MKRKVLSILMAGCLVIGSSSMALAAEKPYSKCTNDLCIVHPKPKTEKVLRCKKIHRHNAKCYKIIVNKSTKLETAEKLLLKKMNVNRALKDMSYLSKTIGPRVTGTNEEYQSAKYIQKQFRLMGYKANIESFQYQGSATGEVTEANTAFTTRVFRNSPTTAGITSEVVYCGLGSVDEFANVDVKGKIVLVQRGKLTYIEKVQNAIDAGAAAVVMYNTSGTSATSGQAVADGIPAVGITMADGEALVARINAGETITLSVVVNAPEMITSWNVVASQKPIDRKDKNNSNEIVYVTAHHDSVPLAPGANDNGSGTVAMLEIARAIKGLDIDKEVRFVACGSEEVGLLGSSAHVANLTEDEKSRIVGSFNADMVATAYEPCSELAVYTNDGKENAVTDAMSLAGKKLACLSTDTVDYNGDYDGPMGSSDHVPFQNAGIAASLFINVDPAKKDNPRSAIEPYYHKPEDVMSNVSKARLERTIKLMGLAVYNTLNVE